MSEADVAELGGTPATFLAPKGMDDCEAVEALVTLDVRGRKVVAIPFALNELDVADLFAGATLWLELWGGQLPPVALHVSPENKTGIARAGFEAELARLTIERDRFRQIVAVIANLGDAETTSPGVLAMRNWSRRMFHQAIADNTRA